MLLIGESLALPTSGDHHCRIQKRRGWSHRCITGFASGSPAMAVVARRCR
jgi:hypothetical protein